MKRLQACRSAILSGASITYIYELYGFRDYSAFFRAFKKEYGISPKEYRDISQASLSAQEAAPE
ncbi:MAG: AraC family transcriptional regulator [Lachnospiraceae bacterium]|nr:AraC family transcriptional regulator [Lachnospiraceae bacterium]